MGRYREYKRSEEVNSSSFPFAVLVILLIFGVYFLVFRHPRKNHLENSCPVDDAITIKETQQFTVNEDKNNYFKGNIINANSENDDENKLTNACCLALGAGLMLLFLFRRFKKSVTWTDLILVIPLLTVAVNTFWTWIVETGKHGTIFLVVNIFVTAVLPISVIIIIHSTLRTIWRGFTSVTLLDIGSIAAILKESVKAIFFRPYLLIIPILAFLIELVILIIFLSTTIYMGLAEALVDLTERYGIYQDNASPYFSTVFDACLTVWTIRCIAGLQNMMLFHAAVRWYHSIIKPSVNNSIFTNLLDLIFTPNIVTLESLAINVMATATSFLAALKTSFLVSSLLGSFIDFLYDKTYYYSGAGCVTLFNLRLTANSLVWNILLGVATSFVVLVVAFWYWWTQERGIVMAKQDLWILTIFCLVLLLILYCLLEFLQNKFGMVTALLKQPLKATFRVPKIVLFSVFFFLVKLIILVAFATKTMNAESKGVMSESIQDYFMFYKYRPMLLFSMVLNGCLAIWILEFIGGVQSMIITTGIAEWYFPRNKNVENQDVQTRRIGYFVPFGIQLLMVSLSLLSTYYILLNTNSVIDIIPIVMVVTCFWTFLNVVDAILFCFSKDWLINGDATVSYSTSKKLENSCDASLDPYYIHTREIEF